MTLAQRVPTMSQTLGPIFDFFTNSAYAQRQGDPEICDLTFGNPHEMPLTGFVESLQQQIVPKNKDWFAYTQSKPEAQAAISRDLAIRLGHRFEPEDILLTNGAFAGLTVAIQSVVDPGDEVIYIEPYWFAYEGMILGAGGVPIKIRIKEDDYNLDLDAIQSSITENTRAIIINTPHNPTGKIFSKETLTALADILTEASNRNGRPIYLISDEAYNQILLDQNEFISPTTIYPHTFLIYTYGKIHLTPGQRIGYIALPHQMPDREMIRDGVSMMQLFQGWAYPNAILQYAIEDLLRLSIDIEQIQARRDRLIECLSGAGCKIYKTEGTFYLFGVSPIEDDWAFIEELAKQDVFCLPGTTFGMPGTFRISLTANDGMVEKSLPVFEQVIRAVTSH